MNSIGRLAWGTALAVTLSAGLLALGAQPKVLAAVAPTVTVEVHDQSHNVVTVIDAGTTIHPKITVSGSAGTPTGTVQAFFYSNGSCSGAEVTHSGDVALVDGISDNNTTAANPEPGTYAFKALYSGDSQYLAGTSNCASVIVLTPPLTPSPSPSASPTATASATAAPTASPTATARPSASPTASARPTATPTVAPNPTAGGTGGPTATPPVSSTPTVPPAVSAAPTLTAGSSGPPTSSLGASGSPAVGSPVPTLEPGATDVATATPSAVAVGGGGSPPPTAGGNPATDAAGLSGVNLAIPLFVFAAVLVVAGGYFAGRRSTRRWS